MLKQMIYFLFKNQIKIQFNIAYKISNITYFKIKLIYLIYFSLRKILIYLI